MADSNDSQPSANSPPMHRRRSSSIAGQTFADLYEAARSRQVSNPENSIPQSSPQFPPGSISSAFQAHRRRLSLTTVGLATSPNNNAQASPFAGFGAHRDSTTSTSTMSVDESAVEDDPGTGGSNNTQPQGSTPFARRMSFGARAMRDAKTGPSAHRPGRSMNGDSMAWVDSFVGRGDRRASITFPREMPSNNFKMRSQSVASEQQTQPVAAIPSRAVPDAYSERLLRGEVDF